MYIFKEEVRRTVQVAAGIPIWNGHTWWRALDTSGWFWSPDAGGRLVLSRSSRDRTPLFQNPVVWKDSLPKRHWCIWTQCWHGAELGIPWQVRQWVGKLDMSICFYSNPGNKSLGILAVNKPSCIVSLLNGNSVMRSLVLANFLGHRRTILGWWQPHPPKLSPGSALFFSTSSSTA